MGVPVATAGFIAGRMTATLGATAIGQVADGFTIEHTPRKELVTGDLFGPNTAQDAVYLGMDVFIEFDLMEWNAICTVDSLLGWPYGAVGTAANPGRLDVASTITQQLILTDTGVAGVPAEDLPHTITVDRAILAAGFPVNMLMQPRLRVIPIRMQIYPNASGVFFTLDDGV